MNSKHSVVFFSAGVILILGLILMGFMPMNTSNIMPDSQQIIPIDEKIVLISQQNGYDEKIIQDDKDNDGNAGNNLFVKPIEEMDCTELREFAASFEKGWGSAISLYNEKCP